MSDADDQLMVETVDPDCQIFKAVLEIANRELLRAV